MHLHGVDSAINERMVLLTRICWTVSFIMALLTRTISSSSPSSPSPSSSSLSTSLSCETARMKCAYRTGCGMALQNYMVGCSDVMSGRIRRCPDLCKKALIALTSTDEGQELMRCECGGQEFCEASKRRVEVCRPDVMRANAEHSIVSCSVAQWICAADPLCSTALKYYRRLCRSMFFGKKCTLRCNNSISILNRQEKAAKLRTCECDGTEDYDCAAIRLNMDQLCIQQVGSASNAAGRQQHQHRESDDDGREGLPNEIAVTEASLSSSCHSRARHTNASFNPQVYLSVSAALIILRFMTGFIHVNSFLLPMSLR